MSNIVSLHGFICSKSLYEFDGWLFEYHRYLGPWPVRKDGEPYKRAGKKFWDMFDRFERMSDAKQESYRIGGGCQRF